MPGAQAPLVTVVIVNFNGRHHLERCLPALMATTGVPFDVIVADNGSTDGSLEWLVAQWPKVRVLALGRNLGFGAANNRALAVAEGEFVALLNNDTEVEPGWLAGLLEPLQADSEIAASCSTLRLLELPHVLNARGGAMTFVGYGYDIDFMVPAERPPARAGDAHWHDVLFPTAAAAVLRTAELRALGGFDPAMFMYHEDVDLGLRLWMTGRRVVVCDRSIVRHAWGGTSRRTHGLAWRAQLGMRHNVRTLLKCYGLPTFLRAAWRIARIWRAQRDLHQALAVCRWNLAHLPSTLAERRRLQRRKVRSEHELLRRGLVTVAAFPPPPPQAPAPADAAAAADWLVTPTLLPGQHSAEGRLGVGWLPPERLDDTRVRWTCGLAECALRVAPGAAGHVDVELRFDPDAGDPTVTLTCNGRTTTARADRGWAMVSVPAAADGQGLLHLRIASPTVVPYAVRGTRDFRVLGCAVRAVRFRAASPPPPRGVQRVSVIVPTFNRWPILERSLEALAAQTYRDFQAIVVDDGSTDGTWERLQAWRRTHAGRLDLTPLHQENLKPGRARNLALRHADGDLVLFLGDDIIAAPDLVAEHVAAHRRIGEPVGVLGFTDWDREHMRVTPLLELVNRDGQQFAYGHFRDGDDLFFTCFYTSNISLPRDVLGSDPFHPAFTFVDWEDTELGYRLARRGLRLILHRAAQARHTHPMTMASFLARQQHVGRTVGVLMDLHPELIGHESMPVLDPPWWFPLARPTVRAFLPALSWLDRLGIPFPYRVHRHLLLTAFFAGRQQAAREGVPMRPEGPRDAP